MSKFDNLKELSVLFVEDDNFARTAMLSILKNIFGDVTLADNGKNGLEIFTLFNSDIVITDLWMPEMSGLEMIAKIREHNTSTVIVVMSAYDCLEQIRNSEELEIFGFLKKPFMLNDFEKVLKDAGQKALEIKKNSN
jgi:YesN/AraC family two-component response regulator